MWLWRWYEVICHYSPYSAAAAESFFCVLREGLYVRWIKKSKVPRAVFVLKPLSACLLQHVTCVCVLSVRTVLLLHAYILYLCTVYAKCLYSTFYLFLFHVIFHLINIMLSYLFFIQKLCLHTYVVYRDNMADLPWKIIVVFESFVSWNDSCLIQLLSAIASHLMQLIISSFS